MVWVALILVIFGFGVQNISLAVTDYYNYDKITNIDRVTPQNVTFPAILVCFECYAQEYYYRSEFVKFNSIMQNDLNVSLIKNFLYDSSFFKNEYFPLDFFYYSWKK